MSTFVPIEQIEKLTAEYLALDERCKMRARNGMTREMFLNYSILNSYINENNLILDRDEFLAITSESLTKTAVECAPLYHRTPEELVIDFRRCSGTEFLDPKERERIETGFRELSKH